ncbi:hypothetical protein [Cupriavidus sp. 8B]
MLLIRLPSDEPVPILRPNLPDGLDHFLNDTLILVVGVLPTGGLDASQVFHVLEPTMAIRHKIYQLDDAMTYIYWHKLFSSSKFMFVIGSLGEARRPRLAWALPYKSLAPRAVAEDLFVSLVPGYRERDSRSQTENSTKNLSR